MPNSVMAMEGEDDTWQMAATSTRPRLKKKSTLTKLKEKKQKEFGSSTSLQQEKDVDITTRAPEVTHKKSAGLLDTDKQSDLMLLSSSPAKHSSKEPLKESDKPKTKPRGRRRSSDITLRNFNLENDLPTDLTDNLENVKMDSSNGATIQMFTNLKMDEDQVGSVESTVNQSGFLPRPPAAPRTSRSNPRTPRGFVVTGKGEKRFREPYSSGDEPEIEERKDKNNKISNDPSRVKDINPVLHPHSTEDALIDSPRKSSTTSEISTVSKNSKMLIQRSKGDSDKKDIHAQKNPEFETEHENYTSAHIEDNFMNFNNNGDNGLMIEDSRFISEYPNDKLIISADTSKNPSELIGQMPSSRISQFDSSFEKNNHNSSPSHFSVQINGRDDKSSIQVNNENSHLLSDEQWTDAAKDSSTAQSEQVVSHLKSQSVLSPLKTFRLSPINARSHPPPLPDAFSSKSLRTMYKIDPEINSTMSTPRFKPYMDKSDLKSHSNGDLLSQKSFTSASVLPVITVQEARSRNLPEGSTIIGSPSTLGADELDRYFPERKVNVFVGTWNMNELKDLTSSSIDDFILPIKCDYVQDIYAIGTQENNMNRKEWEIKIQETLGLSHVLYHSVSHGSLHLAVFIRRDLIWFCTVPEDDIISLRAVAMVKTKGAVGICFTLFGTSYLFINCHLTSDRDNDTSRKKNRLGDYHKVITEMKLPKLPNNVTTSQKQDITAVFDLIFWFGDLNFRIERQRQAVEKKVNQITSEEIPNFETLLGGDQLIKYMAEGKIFGGFQEGRVNFHPTFKFDVGSEKYDSSVKNRVPSYTDRVMFRCKKKNDITCIQYDAVMDIKLSDHRPVYGLYETTVRPAMDSVSFSVGHFDKSVYMEGNRRRAATKPLRKKQSVICVIQ